MSQCNLIRCVVVLPPRHQRLYMWLKKIHSYANVSVTYDKCKHQSLVQAPIIGACAPLYLRLPEDDALAPKRIAVFKNLCTFCKVTICTSRCV